MIAEVIRDVVTHILAIICDFWHFYGEYLPKFRYIFYIDIFSTKSYQDENSWRLFIVLYWHLLYCIDVCLGWLQWFCSYSRLLSAANFLRLRNQLQALLNEDHSYRKPLYMEGTSRELHFLSIMMVNVNIRSFYQCHTKAMSGETTLYPTLYRINSTNGCCMLYVACSAWSEVG